MTPEHFVSRLELAAQKDAVRWARRHARDVLSIWRVHPDHIETAALVVSELVTNAVQHVIKGTPATGPARLTLILRHRGTHLIVKVADPDVRPPVMQGAAAPSAESGRGLLIVESVSKEWGYYLPPTGGKVVWSSLALVWHHQQ
ncbi:putative regulator [Streptomyces zinciresistens K42]|uniref:Putative regulator n=1 Tax=Streptomyces zinciresistens K42 TaxID=700597 RepID=G2G5H6_9ACTN|nr:ATP-binding protein [Streptomyces zinciresistens]EGX61356.1 putative regulator [Streptomyces zinciresistens K42]